MDRVYKEERNHILSLVKKVKASGCNVLLIQKSILRDAVTDLSLHYLVSCQPQHTPPLPEQAGVG
jgi:T-complex protein 1 subunit delta